MRVLILAGGSGTRFWPVSRRQRPKQLLDLQGGSSLLQQTAARLGSLVEPEAIWVSTTRELAEPVRDQLPEVPAEQILAEPIGRNTAPAIGWALSCMPAEARRDVVAVLPSDHWMQDSGAFCAALHAAAEEAAARDRVVTLGVPPRWVETGYGYLELASIPDTDLTARRVKRFIEKPDAATAEGFLRDGRHLWNAGIFVFRGDTMLQAIESHLPDLAACLEVMAEEADPGHRESIYAGLAAVSIDTGVMEQLDDIYTIPLDCGWNDLGSWGALAEVLPADADGNRARGNTIALEARDNLLFADHGTIAVLGVEGLAVVNTSDAVLVLPKDRAQDVRRLVNELEARGRDELL